jgi:hypothetical protein
MYRTRILTGLALLTAAVVGAPAGVAAAESPADTIGLLEAQGYRVNIDRIGSAPIEECVVVSVRNPQTVTRLVRVERNSGRGSGHHGDGGDDDRGNRRRDYDLVEVVVSRSISVSLDCTG